MCEALHVDMLFAESAYLTLVPSLYVAVCLVGATLPRVINCPAPISAEEEETLSFRPVGVNTLESGTGECPLTPLLFLPFSQANICRNTNMI